MVAEGVGTRRRAKEITTEGGKKNTLTEIRVESREKSEGYRPHSDTTPRERKKKKNKGKKEELTGVVFGYSVLMNAEARVVIFASLQPLARGLLTLELH